MSVGPNDRFEPLALTHEQYGLVERFKADRKLQIFWEQHGRLRTCSSARLPDIWVSCEGPDGSTVSGILLACDTDGPRNEQTSYDFDGRYAVLDLHGGIGWVNGWQAMNLKANLIDPALGLIAER